MPGPVPGIHEVGRPPGLKASSQGVVFGGVCGEPTTWMAGTSPAMTISKRVILH